MLAWASLDSDAQELTALQDLVASGPLTMARSLFVAWALVRELVDGYSRLGAAVCASFRTGDQMSMSGLRLRRIGFVSGVVVVALMIWLLINDFHLITADELGGDAVQNVRSSVNLAKYGIYSRQPISPEVIPGYRREPLPNFLLAFYLRSANVFSPGLLDQVGQPFSDAFLVFVKQINLVWAAGLFLGLWLTSQLVFTPLLVAHGLTVVQMLAVNKYFVAKTVDKMNTELIAGMVLVWLGAVLLMATRSRSWRWLVASGSVFGLMALTKTTGAYLALIILPLVALILSGISKRFWLFFLAISFGFLITVTPWVLRNQGHFSKPVIAGGGDDVLLIRSVFNQMNRQQLIDAFYAYAPRDMRHDLLGPLMDLSDDEFSCEGRLSVFTRDLDCDREALRGERYDDVRSFYQQGKRAIPRDLSLQKDDKMGFALRSFQEKPLNALVTGLPIGWRGIWGFGARTWPGIVFNLAAYLALLAAPVMALLERRASWLMVSIVPVSLFLFYSLLSHFLPRYSTPLVPSALVCLTMLVIDLAARLSGRLRPGRQSPVRLL